MPQQTKIFRVFVSSTFTDMKEERSTLQKKLFPKLEKFCEENGARFQAVDLRWGVNEESQLNQKTLEICLNEIARCQKISPKPNFLILLGDKYGWQPIPTKIPESEMSKIRSVIDSEKAELMDCWYRLDSNAIPPEYVLQPRGEEYTDYIIWEKVEKKLQSALREAVNQLSFSEEQRIKYFTSATHQEIMSGALNPVDVKEKPEDHVFAMIRETEGLTDDNTAEGFIDLINDQSDPYSKEQLRQLKGKLKEKLGNQYNPYKAKWKEKKTEMYDPAGFENTIYNFLENIIKEQLKDVISPDEISHEVKLHSEFKTKLTEHFCGRTDILNTIKTYLNNPAEKRVLAMIGDSGSGKSSVMAKAIQEAGNNFKDALIIYRFIGTSSRSSNIISLLQSVCEQIAAVYGTKMETLAGEGREKSLYDLNGLTEILKKCLALGTAQKPVLLFLDALDQLSDSDNAKSLYWLPRELPEHTRMVVSSLPELKTQLSNHCIVDLPLLPIEEASKILERWLNSISRKLTVEQQKEVLNKFSKTGLPIYLKLAFERAKKWNSYTKKEDYSLKEDVKGIINDFIGLLEEEHTEDFVKDVICLMLCGRYQGLAENEILEIFAFDKELWQEFLNRTNENQREALVIMKEDLENDKKSMKIPIVVWSRLFLDLEPYLTERDADGVPIITFFHRQFNEVLRERYKLSDQT
ncbi:MAG TPA: AAA family ATPase [Bacteroidales bacterium]